MFFLVATVYSAAAETRGDDYGVTAGAGVSVSTSPYKDYDNAVTPLPLIMYDGDRFYAKGVSAGVHVFKDDTHTLSVGATYSGQQFEPGDTDSRPHQLLDKRKSTVMTDVSYSLTTRFGRATARVSRDVLGRSDGYTTDAGFSVPILREKFTIVPSVGVEWSSGKQAEYYYGVSSGESIRSGLNSHEVSSNFFPYLGLHAQYRITERWSAVAGTRLNVLTGDVKDSPMVDKSVTVSGFLGATFSF